MQAGGLRTAALSPYALFIRPCAYIALPDIYTHTPAHSAIPAPQPGMRMTIVPLHIAGGAIAIVAGGIALYAAKGGKLHRKSGAVFFWAMLAMTCSAIVIGLMRGHRFNASQGALTLYLVTSGMLAVRDPQRQWRSASAGAMLLALLIALYDVSLGLDGLRQPRQRVDGLPAVMMFVFGAIPLLAALGDLRYLRASEFSARKRVARHLWRMGLALWIAAASFFLGQAKMIPEPLRIKPLLALPVLMVAGALLYWVIRVGVRGRGWAPAGSGNRGGL